MQRVVATGSPEPARQGRPLGGGKLQAHQAFLIEQVQAKPDITMPERAAELAARHGVTASPAWLSRVLCKAGFIYKKAPMASEQARADVRERRRGWIEQRRPRMRASPARLVFIDETAVTTKMTPCAAEARAPIAWRPTPPSAAGKPRPSSPACAAAG